jgi:prophage regulatory protein
MTEARRDMRVLPITDLGPLKGIPYSRAHIYRLMKAGKFPKPIRLGENRIAFVEREIDDWLEQRMIERDVPDDAIVEAARELSERSRAAGLIGGRGRKRNKSQIA